MPPRGFGSGRPPATPRSALHRALRLLARRAHTRHELARKLRERGEAPADIEAALERLGGLGYLDDHAFAASFVEARGGPRGGWGTARLRVELARRGVARDIVEAVLGGRTQEDDVAAARAVLGRRPRRDEPRARLTLFLRQRGYSSGVIRQVLGEQSSFNREE